MSKFKIGQLVCSAGVSERINENEDFSSFIFSSILKYLKCDWGDTCEVFKKVNDHSVKTDNRILAVYIYPETKEKVLFITGWDRSTTTILFLYEY